MMEAVDRADAAQLFMEDILDPRRGSLSFLMDPRTGLGRFRDFRISNYQLMMDLIDSCLNHSIQEILATPDVAERVALYREHADAAAEQIRRCSTLHGPAVVLDLRDEEIIHPTTAFSCTRSIRRQGVDPRPVGPAPAEHGVRCRPLHPGPLIRLNIGALMLAMAAAATRRPEPARSPTTRPKKSSPSWSRRSRTASASRSPVAPAGSVPASAGPPQVHARPSDRLEGDDRRP